MNTIEKISGAKANKKGLLPTTSGALYVAPHPDGKARKCKTCMMWISKEDQCEIHAKNIMVTKDHICGYYVWGKPHPHRMHEPDGIELDPVDPKHSGLELTPQGTMCGNCEYYKKKGDKSGICQVVQTDTGKLAIVEALGCCARWESK